jgi:hypothetical protein
LAASTVIANTGSRKSVRFDPKKYPIVRRWNEAKRAEQKAYLSSIKIQWDLRHGYAAWAIAAEAHRNLPEGVRVDLPTPKIFAQIIGLVRTCATLKKKKWFRVELSAGDIAELLRLSKATVEAALRWLSSGPIEYHGEQVSRGIGYIHRCRRTGAAYLGGVLRKVYRTSVTVLTEMGQALLGLAKEATKKVFDNFKAKMAKKTPKLEAKPTAELEHIQGHGDDGGGRDTESHLKPTEVGRNFLLKIQERL